LCRAIEGGGPRMVEPEAMLFAAGWVFQFLAIDSIPCSHLGRDSRKIAGRLARAR